jgi:aspartyl-tRNA(Asn)/glutamyl-tRNA(Gln) amidotransferase subunit A
MTACVENPGSLRVLAAAIASGELTATALVNRYLTRIEAVQPLAEPWREVDAAGALAAAAERDAQAARGDIMGPLHGIPFGVKDIIDVAGLPTRCNSKALQDRPPATADAEVVLALKAAGAIVLGKLHTTEFAFFDPSPARNPHDTDRTPGGSSSGSGAAVASGTVPLALGTQTMASVNRPASYCGISAFKPSTRSLSTFGASPLAPSYDTIGFYGWDVDSAVYAYEAVTPFGITKAPATDPFRIVFLEDDLIADADADMAAAVAAMLDTFADAGHEVARKAPPLPFARLVDLHRSTMAFEAARTLAHLTDYPDGQIGARILALIAEGRGIAPEDYLRQRAELNAHRTAFFAAAGPADLFFWPAAPGPAPLAATGTGEPKYIAPWTLLGGPVVSMPVGTTASGLPLGAILSGHPGSDRATGAAARILADVAA